VMVVVIYEASKVRAYDDALSHETASTQGD